MTVGYVDGRPVPRTELDRRLTALRSGPRAGALPVPGSAEDRQLTRWVAQVILTEELCAAEAAARGLSVDASGPVRIDQRAAVELGSITAAAYEHSPAVRAVFAAVTAGVEAPAGEVAAYRANVDRPAGPVWRVAMAGGEFDADPDTLPGPLAAALRAALPGHAVSVDGWTATLVGATDRTGDRPDATQELTAAARRVTFVRWLELARARHLRLVPGLEHPGDPRQPDNLHRH